MSDTVFGQPPTTGDPFDAPPRRRTGLDFIRDMQAQRKAAAVRTVKLTDTQRPEFELTCRVPTDLDELLDLDEKATAAAKDPGTPKQEVILNCMTLARLCQVLRIKGVPTSDDPTGSAFADPALHTELGIEGPGAAWRSVRQLFIGDGGQPDDGIIGRFAGALSAESGTTRNTVIVDKDPT